MRLLCEHYDFSERSFFPKNWWIFWKKGTFSKSVKVANLPQNATEIVKVLETFKIWLLQKKLDEFFQKKHEILKIANDSKIVLECDWNITISRNVNFFPKNWWIFWKKGIISKSVKVANLQQNATELVKVLQTFTNWFL